MTISAKEECAENTRLGVAVLNKIENNCVEKCAYNGFYNRYVKRMLDILICCVALLILWPIYLVIGLFVAMEDGFPIFYRAERGGYRGEKFRICKFRTMVKNADQIGGGTTALHDPRITKVGRFLRKTSIDELPQLYNILVGQLSFVGPRPVTTDELEKYGDNKSKVLSVVPGLTGWWACNGRSNVSYEERMQLELYYVEHASIGLDIKIMFKTIGVVFTHEGAV